MFIQRDSIVTLINYCIFGYHHTNEKLNLMMKGGGILSMVNVSLIVGISSSYSGIFKETEMLVSLKKIFKRLF